MVKYNRTTMVIFLTPLSHCSLTLHYIYGHFKISTRILFICYIPRGLIMAWNERIPISIWIIDFSCFCIIEELRGRWGGGRGCLAVPWERNIAKKGRKQKLPRLFRWEILLHIHTPRDSQRRPE